MNSIDSGWTRSKFVSDITNETMIGPAVNSASPISHGPMNTNPHPASRTDLRANGRARPVRVETLGIASADSAMGGLCPLWRRLEDDGGGSGLPGVGASRPGGLEEEP